MESDKSARQLKIIPLLPFMNKLYLQNYLKVLKQGDNINDIEIKQRNDLPYEAIILFKSQSEKEKFTSLVEGKKFENYDHPIIIADKKDSEKEESAESEFSTLAKITFGIEYYNLVETSYERSMKESGLVFKDKDIIQKQDKVISFLIKKIGSNLIKGQSIMNVSLPVNIFDKRTLLQVQAYEMSFAPIFLSKAFYSLDKVEKMKCVTTFLVSQLRLSPLQTKPFSPIIGETFQCTIGDLEVYIEHTVNKPPTYNFYMTNSSGLYKIHGYMSTDASTGANSVKAKKIGRFIIEFKGGQVYEIHFPQIHLKGMTMGKRLFNFRHIAIVSDITNGLTSFIEFNPDERGTIMSIFSSQKTYPDTFRGDILAASDVQIDAKGHKHIKKKNAKSVSSISGEWTKFIAFDNKCFWQVKDHNLIPLTKMAFTLPSDSLYRGDLNFLLNEDEENAQAAKEKLEDIQRNDRKLRESFSSLKIKSLK